MSPRSTARLGRTPLADMAPVWHEFFFNHGVAKDAGDKRDKAKGKLKKWFEDRRDPAFYTDENGSVFYDLPGVLEIGGRKYDGLENRRRATPKVDIDRVEDWLDTLPEKTRDELTPQLFDTIVTVDLARLPEGIRAKVLEAAADVDVQLDESALYRLNQEKKVPDKMLDPANEDGFIVTDVTWALYPKLAL